MLPDIFPQISWTVSGEEEKERERDTFQMSWAALRAQAWLNIRKSVSSLKLVIQMSAKLSSWLLMLIEKLS